MKRSKICKFSIACAIICGVFGGIAALPFLLEFIEVLLLSFVLVSFFVEVFYFGALCSTWGVNSNFHLYGTECFAAMAENFGNLILPIIRFSVYYVTPYAGIIALIFGVMGIVASSVTISKERDKQKANNAIAPAEQPAQISQTAEAAELVETTETATANAICAPAEAATLPAKGKKEKRAKKKSDKRAGIASLVVCSVFTLFSLISTSISVIYVCRAIIQFIIS